MAKEYYDKIIIVFLHEENVFGEVEKLGAFMSEVTYKKDGKEITEMVENDEFAIVDEIVFHHVEEDN